MARTQLVLKQSPHNTRYLPAQRMMATGSARCAPCVKDQHSKSAFFQQARARRQSGNGTTRSIVVGGKSLGFQRHHFFRLAAETGDRLQRLSRTQTGQEIKTEPVLNALAFWKTFFFVFFFFCSVQLFRDQNKNRLCWVLKALAFRFFFYTECTTLEIKIKTGSVDCVCECVVLLLLLVCIVFCLFLFCLFLSLEKLKQSDL